MTATRRMRGRTAGFAVVVVVALVTGCSPIKRNYGYTPPETDLQQLAIGRDTRDTVTEKIGAPLNEGMNRGNNWYYVSSRRQTVGPFEPEVTDRQIVALRFSEAGTLQNVERYGLEDGRVVVLSRRVTDDSVPDTNLLRRIFGNLGTPTAGDFLQ
jgi:outer membrane protein assembly factor BamE (lipoprotein component of BamABCDE complex)